MAEELILIFTPTAPTLGLVAQVLDGFPEVQLQGDHQVVVRDGAHLAFLRPWSNAAMVRDGLFEDWPPEVVPARAEGLTVRYRSVPFAKRVVLPLIAAFPCLIDTNFGEIYTCERFHRWCIEDEDWSWQRDDAVGGDMSEFLS